MEEAFPKFRPRPIYLFLFSVLPIVSALLTGFWLSDRIQSHSNHEAEKIRMEEAIAQDRLLVDSLWASIELIKTRALALLEIRKAQAVVPNPSFALPEGVLLHWAELEIKLDDSLLGVRQAARNPAWAPAIGWSGFEEFYLQSVLKRLSVAEIRKNGIAVLRMKQDPGRNHEWLALAFAGSDHNSVVLALVDPEKAFPVFSDWSRKEDGDTLRGYLVAADGTVLAHSQPSYVAASFAQVAVFKNALADLLGRREVDANTRLTGNATSASIDKLMADTAYARLGPLPLAAVVERVTEQPSRNPILASALAAAWGMPGVLAQTLGICLLLCLFLFGGMEWLARKGGRGRLDGALRSWQASRQALGQEAATLDEVQSPQQEPGSAEIPLLRLEDVQPSQSVEAQFVAELLSAQDQSRVRAEKLWVAQLEIEATRTGKDPSQMARRLAQITTQATGCPSFYFGFQEKQGTAILQAHEGLAPGSGPGSMAFRLSDAMMRRIARYHSEGKVASVADDPSLAALIFKRFHAAHFEAWAVTSSQGALVGVLVALLSDSTGEQRESLNRVLAATREIFEPLRS